MTGRKPQVESSVDKYFDGVNEVGVRRKRTPENLELTDGITSHKVIKYEPQKREVSNVYLRLLYTRLRYEIFKIL